MSLEIRLIGPFRAMWQGEERPVSSRRGRAIVGLLALSPGRSIPRDRLAAMLWPDRDETQARASLRQELSALKKALGADCAGALQADSDRVRLCEDGEIDVDVWAILDGSADPDAALDHAGGELLEGSDIRSESYDDWLAEQRRALAARLADLAEARIATARGARDWEALGRAASVLRALDPYSETAAMAAMTSAHGRGRVTEALEAFEDFRARLAADLQAAPGPATIALRDEIAGAAPTADPVAPEIFDRPAVLLFAFDCLSGSPEDAMIAMGLADDLHTTLSYWRWFPVIGPDAIGWKTARSGDLRAIAAEVGAAYAVTGTLRRADDRVRITAGLTDAATGRTVWSENFDGTLGDIFAFQEDVSRAIVGQLEPHLASAEAARIARARPQSIAAWQLMAQADEIDRRGGEGYGTPDSNFEQIRLMEEALQREPDFAPAHARLGRIYFRAALLDWLKDRDAVFTRSLEHSRRALELDPENWEAHAYTGLARIFGTREYAAGRFHGAEAVRLNPSAALARHAAGCALEWIGSPREALEHLNRIFLLNPAYNGRAAALGDITTSEMFVGNMEAAVDAARKLLAIAPAYARGLQRCVATFGLAGETALAREALAKLMAVHPDFDETYVRETYPYARAEDLDVFLEGLRKGGAFAS